MARESTIKQKILIYDSDKGYVSNVSKTLAQEGYEVDSTSGLEDAIKKIQEKNPAIFVFGANGNEKLQIEEIKKIREQDDDLAIFVIADKAHPTIQGELPYSFQRYIKDKSVSKLVAEIQEYQERKTKIEEIFNAVVSKQVGNNGAKYVDSLITRLETNQEGMARRTFHSPIEEIKIRYERKGENHVLYAINKRNEFEARVYKLIAKDAAECLVKPYACIPEEEECIIQLWGKDRFEDFGMNTLEEDLETFTKNILIARGDEDTEIKLGVERTRELENLARKIATFHFNATYALDNKLGPDKLKEAIEQRHQKIIISEEDGTEWSVPFKSKEDYIEHYLECYRNILLSKWKWADKQKQMTPEEIAANMQYLKGILAEEPDLFAWYNCKPLVLLHGDLHERNVCKKEKESENIEQKLIDLKNVKFGPAILDFGWVQNPIYSTETNVKTAIYKAYIEKIADLQKDRKFGPLYEDIRQQADSADLVHNCYMKQNYWNMRVANEISKEVHMTGVYERFKIYLSFLVEDLLFIYKQEGHDNLKKLHDLFKRTLTEK